MLKTSYMQSIKNRTCVLLASMAVAVIGASCSDDDAPAVETNNWDAEGNEIINIKPERYKMLRNPFTGWVMYAGLGDGLADSFWEDYDNFTSSVGKVKVSDYSNVLFIRAAWSYFNPEEGKYIWNEGEVNSK